MPITYTNCFSTVQNTNKKYKPFIDKYNTSAGISLHNLNTKCRVSW